MPPSTRARPALRRPQIVAAAALLLAIVIAIAFALRGGGDEPSLREQYGGHGGAPVNATGAEGRVALDGRWRMANDPNATGADRGWSRGRFGGRTVTLPFVPNAGRITGAAGERSHEGSVAWYRTTLRVPRDGTYAVRFESVNHQAIVWLDGKRVAEHTGEYLPFEARVPLAAGRTHQLVVRADWRDPDAMKAAGWHRTWFNYGGINREVTIRPLGDAEVVTPTVRTTLRGKSARVEITARARNLTGEARTIAITGKLGEQEVTLPAVRVPGRASREVRAVVDVEKPRLWSQRDPQLYDLTLEAGDGETGGWRGRIGLRELRRDGSTLLLNGEPVKLIGASLHEDAMGRGDGLRATDMDELVSELKDLHANATRAQHPLSPALLERLDAAGILIWQGIGPVDAPGAWTSKTPAQQQQARDRVRASVAQLQTHPSIVAWNLANEVAGQGHPDGQPEFIRASARELHRRDPGRLVALDVWGAHPPKEPGPMYEDIDAIGWTNYLGWYEATYATSSELATLIETQLADFQRIFPDKVLAVTEFGAEGSSRNATDEPGGFAFQARVLRTHLETYGRMQGLSGMLVWNLRDFGVAPSFGGGSIVEVVPGIKVVPGLNEKGLHRYDGRPKPAAAVVRSEFSKLTGR